MSSGLTVSKWSDSDFELGESAWQALLPAAESDNLFLSWYWVYNWWQTRKKPDNKLCIIAVYDQDRLIALAPLYKERQTYFRGLLSSCCLQFIGKRLIGDAGIRSEYQDFIVHKDYRSVGLSALLAHLDQDREWTELYLGDFNRQSQNYPQVMAWLKEQKLHGRLKSGGETYRVDCSGHFDDYLAGLGKNTRLKLYNRRSLLAQQGKIDLVGFERYSKNEFFTVINRMHRHRWQKPAFSNKDRNFLENLPVMDESEPWWLSSSIMTLDGQPLSAMLNLTYNGCVYNIQLGFVERYHKKIALGTLHLGYAIEQAFNDPEVYAFDLLEGEGKNTNYKSHLAPPFVTLESSRWMRSLALRLIFGFYDRFLRR